MPGVTVRMPPELHSSANADSTVIVKQIALQTVAAKPAVPGRVRVDSYADASTSVVEPTTLATLMPGARGEVERQPATAKSAWTEEIGGWATKPVVVAKPQNEPLKPQFVGTLATECAVPRHRGPGGLNYSGDNWAVNIHGAGRES